MKKRCGILLLLTLLLTLIASGCGQQAAETEPSIFSSQDFSGTMAATASSPQAADPPSESDSQAEARSVTHKIPADEEKSLLKQAQAAVAREKRALQSAEAVLTFAGDCTIGSFPECSPQKRFDTLFHADGSPTYPFDLVKEWFQADDLSIINFEGTLTTATKMADKSWRFKGEPDFAKILPRSGIEVATIANNHSWDYLEAGHSDTVKYLAAENVMVGDEDRPVKFTANGMDFIILSRNIWPITDIKQTNEEVSALCEEIARYSKENLAVIVCIHWGIENDPVTGNQRTYARQIIDAGAELIIGHHPHILQGIEQYKGKFICYSLGNFAFGGNAATRTDSLETMLVRPRFSKTENRAVCTGLSIVPCYSTSHPNLRVNNYRPKPVFGEEAQKVIDKVLRLSSVLPNGITKLDTFSIEN